MFTERESQFAGRTIVDFEGPESWQGTGRGYRVFEEYDDKTPIAARLEKLLSHPGANELEVLVIGAWGTVGEGDSSESVVSFLVTNKARLPALKALFIGDISYEECELSWINQYDLAPVLWAFPQLELLQVRGGNGLAFSKTRHPGLKQLVIQAGGLGSSVLRQIFLCDFPNLERLELYLGESNYGFDGTVEDLQPLLAGGIFPNLKHLGLMNSEIADDIAAVVVNSPLTRRLHSLDLSLGNLSDQGAQSLLALPTNGELKQLKLEHHYVSANLIEQLKQALPFEVEADEAEEQDDDWRGIMHAE